MQALDYYEDFFKTFEKIAQNPFMFSSASHIKFGFRSCVCGVDTIYYKILDEFTIEINTIIGRQDF